MTQKVPANMTVEDLTDAEVVHKTGNETIAGVKTFSGTAAVSGTLDISAATLTIAEANWTPSVGGTATYNARFGAYHRIGRFVFFHGYIQINVIGTGSTSEISGPPIGNIALAMAAPVVDFSGLAANVVSMSALVTVSATPVIRLYSQTVASAAQAQNAVLGNGSNISFSGWYYSS